MDEEREAPLDDLEGLIEAEHADDLGDAGAYYTVYCMTKNASSN